ncbi:acetoacetate decarboxylase [Kineobactrum sediminis]|uniref:Acetoacetate decarboxylase n=1 Tax=Kineobactrum sediminis TaxID=1905677 RepID=A0A2N5Y5F6_9GAMM|nr:acetoacetate decarboxylase family protein [Kineobactrum sediminis]PLW83602.1 acetoacetate decarboxylase [Kineobactrum sediminis]
MSNATGAPQGNPGDITNWPMLKVVYRTDPDKIAALLPPGIEPGANPHVTLTIYNFPVPDEPEFGILTTVDADYNGIAGEYTLGYGIDQESAIFNSQEINGQPKYPCTTDFYRMGDSVTARCTHQGYTFAEFRGTSTGATELPPEFELNEWWIKVSRAVGLMPDPARGYDFPPHVVHVRSTYGTAWREAVEGELVLRDSPWDPLASLLPMREQVSAHLWWPIFLGREITLAGKLDPDAFMPFADTISGSRWPGTNGGPRRS